MLWAELLARRYFNLCMPAKMQDALRHPQGDPSPLATSLTPGNSFGLVSAPRTPLPLWKPTALGKADQSDNPAGVPCIMLKNPLIP